MFLSLLLNAIIPELSLLWVRYLNFVGPLLLIFLFFLLFSSETYMYISHKGNFASITLPKQHFDKDRNINYMRGAHGS